METYSITLWLFGLALLMTLILRAKSGGLFLHFPLFYSYIAYTFSGSLITFVIYRLRPGSYPTSYWFYFLINLLAEFAVLVEISDHVFKPYPAIRQFGRFLTICISTLFFILYILPSFLQFRPSSLALLDFSLRTSLTKMVIIVALGAAARYYRLPLGRNVAGLMMGFALYLGIYIVSLAAAQIFGKVLYAAIFRFMLPLGSILCLLAWTVAMWQFEVIPRTSWKLGEPGHETLEELSYRLSKLNTTLTRLVRK
jgi:hypothetical protein